MRGRYQCRSGGLVPTAVACLALLMLPGCHETFHGDPCSEVSCSGHGACRTDGARAWCVCGPGFRPAGLECLAPIPGSDGGPGRPDGSSDGAPAEAGHDGAAGDANFDGDRPDGSVDSGADAVAPDGGGPLDGSPSDGGSDSDGASPDGGGIADAGDDGNISDGGAPDSAPVDAGGDSGDDGGPGDGDAGGVDADAGSPDADAGPLPWCGDENCDSDEIDVCVTDCIPSCGDGQCDPGETIRTCAADCGCQAAAVDCSASPSQAPDGCFCDGDCGTRGDCCEDVCVGCSSGCCDGVEDVTDRMGTSITGSVARGDRLPALPCNADTNLNQRMVYSFTPSSDRCLQVSLANSGTDFDTVMGVRSGHCTYGRLAACNDDASASAHSSHVRALAVEAGQIYYVIIEGYNGETGNFELTFDDASGWKWWGPSRVNGGGLPPWRWQSAMAYDSARARAVVFGGSVYQGVPVGAMNDTWEWDGNQWWERSPSHQPENRGAPAMAYDRERGVMVLFGGLGESASLDDTWLWDGDDWLEQSPSREPPAMYGGAMVFDTRRGVTVLFGGFGLAGALAQTWEWDGSDWQNVTPSGDSPAPRLGAAMVYDEQRGVTVLFGGNDSSNWYNDTWEWDGNRWLELHPSSSPDERSHGAFAYDKHRGVAILFGGERDDGGQPLTLGETWEWDGSDWRRVPAASIGEPVEVTGAPMVYDEMNREMMLFQGAQYVRSEGARYIVPYAWFYSTCRTGG